jgi:hypothetical protein
MMMAYGHAISGWCAALMLINALSLFTTTPGGAAVVIVSVIAAFILSLAIALAMAGWAIVPDWDYKNSTISTAFGPFSQIVHKLVLELHYTVCSLTADVGARKPPGAHRGVTHWWPFPIALGGLVGLGCWYSKWILFGVLVVVYTGAIRALTVPDYRPRQVDTIRHRWSMITVHGLIDIAEANPVYWVPIPIVFGFFINWLSHGNRGILFLYCATCLIGGAILLTLHQLKQARKYVNRTHTIRVTYWHRIIIPVGKFGTVLVAANFAFIAIRYPFVVEHGVWMGAIACIGMFLHILGDSPTEMGIPGRKLNQFWRLPKWLAFRAGGPFEILCCWLPMTGLGLYLLPGLRPHAEVMMVQRYIMCGLGILTVGAIIAEFVFRHAKRKAWL